MAYKHYVDQVAPETGRTYDINGTASTIRDTTQYEVVGSDFGSLDIQDVGVLEAQYSKSGTVHRLVTENTASIQMRFKPTAVYNAGDTFTVNGTVFTVRSTMGAVTLPANFFTNGSLVTFLVDWINHILYVPVDPMSYVLGQTNASNLSTLQSSFNTVQTKVNGIEAGAQVNTVTGVKGSSESSYRIGQINITSANVGAVPTSRTVNGKSLSANISLTYTDVSAVPTGRKVNNKPLSSDITLSASDVSAMPLSGGTFTGNAIAYSTARTAPALRNIVFVSSGTRYDQNRVSTDGLLCARA